MRIISPDEIETNNNIMSVLTHSPVVIKLFMSNEEVFFKSKDKYIGINLEDTINLRSLGIERNHLLELSELQCKIPITTIEAITNRFEQLVEEGNKNTIKGIYLTENNEHYLWESVQGTKLEYNNDNDILRLKYKPNNKVVAIERDAIRKLGELEPRDMVKIGGYTIEVALIGTIYFDDGNEEVALVTPEKMLQLIGGEY